MMQCICYSNDKYNLGENKNKLNLKGREACAWNNQANQWVSQELTLLKNLVVVMGNEPLISLL